MRIQLQEQSLRLRVDEDEFKALLEGSVLDAATAVGRAFRLAFRLAPGDVAAIDGTATACTITLPRQDIAALASRLPSRDGLSFDIDGLAVLFDVDVRDSVRRRRQRDRS
ncbi:hypothetical protein [Pinirhizobacter soli]|uniref:hypothetical protein n=1 Tax=Pinirhizobacter soli TaxID=2786953 RepID=UPI00202A06E1|nr:hypothetical protein [Pinirhizobacter soli]